jgi:rubrerythrin
MQRESSEKHERLLALFKVAIEREQESQKMYEEMAQNCDDTELRQVIDRLKDSERMHEELLLERYKFFRADGQFKH